MTTRPAPPRCTPGYQHPPEFIGYAVWLYFCFPLSLRMVEEMLAVRCVMVSHETARQSGLKFSLEIANHLRCRKPRRGDKWHLDEVVIITGKEYDLWGTVDRDEFLLDVLVQSRRDTKPPKHVQRFLIHDLIANLFSTSIETTAPPPSTAFPVPMPMPSTFVLK